MSNSAVNLRNSFIDKAECAVICDALYALEEQLHGGIPMPPRTQDEMWLRIERASRWAGCSADQLTKFWLESAGMWPVTAGTGTTP